MSTALNTKVSPKVKDDRLRIWLIFLSLIMLCSGYFLVNRMVNGLEVTHLSSVTPWGAWIAFYIFFVGLSAGSFLLSTFIYVFKMHQYEKVGRMALFTAIICMLVALTFVLVDLGRPERLLNALIYWNVTSALAYEVHFYVVYILLLAVELYFAMRLDLVRLARENSLKGKVAKLLTFGKKEITDEDKAYDLRWMRILGIIGIPLAIFGVHGGTGTIFAVVKARAAWNTGIFPVIFVVSAMVSGTALLLAMYIIKSKVTGKLLDMKLVQGLAKLMAGFLLVDLGLQFYEYLIAVYGLEHEHLETMKVMTSGALSWSFWGVQLLIGSLIPLLLVFSKKTATSVKAMFIAAILIVIGIIGVRFNIVLPPLIVPVMEGLPMGNYWPTFSEWMISAGIVAMGLFLYTIGERLLPLDELES